MKLSREAWPRLVENSGLSPVDMFTALGGLMEMMGKRLPQDQMEIVDYLREVEGNYQLQ